MRYFTRKANYHRITMWIICAFTLIAAHVARASEPAWLKDYAAHVQQQAKKYRIPGYAFVMYEQGKSPQVYVYGKTHSGGENIRPDTVFRLASVSKTFTSVLMAKLVAQHQLNWTTPVNDMIDDVHFAGQGMDELRLSHIVGQSSGFMPNAYDNLIEADYSLRRVLKQLSVLQPLCQPGECYTYQNALFGVIQDYFVSQNTSYQRQLQEQIITPLGMPTASSGKGGLLASEHWARPHIALAANRWKKGKIESNYYRFTPAAGVNASIEDMTIWLQALLGEFPTVIPPALINDVTTPRVKTSREVYRRGWRESLRDAHYGLGWRIYDFDGHIINYHGGWVKGYRADVAFVPELGVGYVMLMNAESNMINTTTAEFWRRYFANRDAN